MFGPRTMPMGAPAGRGVACAASTVLTFVGVAVGAGGVVAVASGVAALLRNSFHPLLREAGLPRMRFHDLRHSAATLLLAKGIHPKIVAEMLGHSRINTTLDLLYSHVTPTMQRDAALAVEAILRP